MPLKFCGFIWAKCAGRISRDSMSEKTSAATTTKLICEVKDRSGPLRKAQGRNTMIVVKTPKITGFITACVPIWAAFKPTLRPVSTSLWMFSPTTIASSTMTPITRSTAKRDNRLNDTPKKGRSNVPPAKAVIIPTVTQNATSGRKNNISTTITNNAPISAELVIVFIRSLKSLDKSMKWSIFTA